MPVLHPWHEASFGDLAPQTVWGVIEIPRGSRAKYEIDKKTGLLKLDRVIHSSFHYPVNYGFIPQTLGDDGDPLDILILSMVDVEPLCLVEARVIGNMQMIDTGLADDKIIAVAVNDPAVNHIREVNEIPTHFFSELKHFFEQYKFLENKTVTIDEFQRKEQAYTVIETAINLYNEKFKQ
jgi:inorganic pyrophosphatase